MKPTRTVEHFEPKFPPLDVVCKVPPIAVECRDPTTRGQQGGSSPFEIKTKLLFCLDLEWDVGCFQVS